ncbi:uncharacterized protein SAPINGB_P003874 [Magnusiomyces paraingens]|uniref:CBS domain-containing protein n=1 Tax=Magnusiomyces paraingens TaxID=2606893 RepID=A0A5E8BZ09_9ASCO|nr:uncharacterized protein SAPINGB_P003874 [Saprochaete ingens]VVT54035.1 unnamed protein product [Saprochaete ingens]
MSSSVSPTKTTSGPGAASISGSATPTSSVSGVGSGSISAVASGTTAGIATSAIPPVTSDSTSSVASTAVESPSDGRRRQAYRDEAIRRKINTSLSKRGGGSSSTGGFPSGSSKQRRPPPGTVLSLRPSPPLTMKYSATVFEAARLMAAKRENCVLVVDEDDTVCGIFTAKDLAFRVVGANLDSKSVAIEQIMTRNPMCARTDTSATEALNLMVNEGFRHLPIMDDNQDIAGVLDITKCFHEAMEKLERAYNSSRKLYDALEGVQMEGGLAGNSHRAAQIISYVEALKRQMEGPDLTTVLDDTTVPVFVNSKTNAAEAARLMKERNTTAVLVTDNNHITGIVTSKDIVLRVIAAGFNPNICSLVRVMTPQPDFAPQSLTIQSALRQMYDGNYLNLPVMGDNNEIVGIVDVLTLTYATLQQINSISTSDSEGPAWNRFWTSFDDHDTHSTHSDGSGYNQLGGSNSIINQQQQQHLRASTPGGMGSGSVVSTRARDMASPGITSSELAQFNIVESGYEIGPSDSISHAGITTDSVLLPSVGLGSLVGSTARGSVAVSTGPTGGSISSETIPFPFKFKTPSGRVHRVTIAPVDGLEFFRNEILQKMKPDEISKLGGADVEVDEETGTLLQPGFAISYIDDEGDVIAITSSKDLSEAIAINRSLGKAKAELYIHHPDEEISPPAPASIATGIGSVAPSTSSIQNRSALTLYRRDDNNNDDEDDEDDDDGISYRKSARNARRRRGPRGGTSPADEMLIPGVPNELLLPGALVTLAASILAVFALNRHH